MATKKEFDYVLMSIGYYKYAIPKEAAFRFLDMCVGTDMYKWDDNWTEGERVHEARLMPPDEMPTVTLLGPVQFHQALENYKARQERERKEKAKNDPA
jgi:hypothetical protein